MAEAIRCAVAPSSQPLIPKILPPTFVLQPSVRKAAWAPCRATQSGSSPGDLDRFFEPGSEGSSREQLFTAISPVYDELNDQLSFGLHRVWKRMAVKWSGATQGCTALDVCCGSGDLALALAEEAGPSGRVRRRQSTFCWLLLTASPRLISTPIPPSM